MCLAQALEGVPNALPAPHATDMQGRVIGVAIAMPEAGSRGGSSCGVGHAVPIDAARRIVEQLLAHGRVKRPSMGVVLAPQQVRWGF